MGNMSPVGWFDFVTRKYNLDTNRSYSFQRPNLTFKVILMFQYFCSAYVEALANKANWQKYTIKAWDVFFQFITAAMVHGLSKTITPGTGINSEEHYEKSSSQMYPKTVVLSGEF